MSAPSSNSPRDDPVASSTTNPGSQTNSSAGPSHHKAAAAAAADDSDDYTSSSGPSDSEEEESDDDKDAPATATDPSAPRPAHNPSSAASADTSIPRIPALPKPNIHRIQQTPDLLSRLSAFLPQMKTANEQLERDIAAGRAKDIRLDDAMDEDEDEGEREEDGKRYIEMNLGLGVLEEKRPDDEISTSAQPGNEERVLASRPKDSGVLDTLMGNTDAAAAAASKPTIEELEK
ncbi:hypothetical protein ASPACDRAFT_118227 [Aspergillus aculeatus ATCC 16872]|uniref:Uncharacterized protein n=1 Tax=Aspergillus aculeatus (strain ATCC 16872 / CBS 172.66 / WB 5094) TaxID=690307 RepID=A0A1L9WVD5_ASPA1|nr:uncharacterized protein ASPACDRAFT_118227 [Aspergillus aculeatus ATCC 16872]OJK00202.1 hypothetical protein ASPACDRAFT_118227 [Aspergillus aculeatus ATCC 16872]